MAEFERIVANFEDIRADDGWLVEKLRKNALNEYDPREPLPFHLLEYQHDGWLGYLVTLQEELPLIEFTRDFIESISRMGVSGVALISRIENDYLTVEHEAVVTGFIGDEPDEAQREYIQENEQFIKESTEDEIVEYIKPDILHWYFPPNYTTYYRLTQDKRQIKVELDHRNTLPVNFEHLLQAYIQYCFDRQDVGRYEEK